MIPSYLFIYFQEILKISRDKQGENQNMSVGMFKKVHKEMVKEMNIIASLDESSRQQHASEVCNHSFILVSTSNLIIA